MINEYKNELDNLRKKYLSINKLERFHFETFNITTILPDLKKLVKILRICVSNKRLMTKKEREIFYPVDLNMDEVDI